MFSFYRVWVLNSFISLGHEAASAFQSFCVTGDEETKPKFNLGFLNIGIVLLFPMLQPFIPKPSIAELSTGAPFPVPDSLACSPRQ